MKIIAGQFPDKNNRYKLDVLKKYNQLYDNEQFVVFGIHKIIKNQYKDLADLIYLQHAIPSRVSNFYGDFVRADQEKIIIYLKDDEKQNKEIDEIIKNNKIKNNIYDLAIEQSEFGFFYLLARIDENGKPIIDYIPQDQCFKQKDGSYVFMTVVKDPKDDRRALAFTQNYELIDKDIHITREAWVLDDRGIIADKYDFEKLKQMIGLNNVAEEEVIKDLGRYPIVQVDNGKRDNDGYGRSDYFDIMPQLSELNEKTTHVSTVILKNLDAKMQLPPSSLNEDGKLKSTEAYIVEKEDVEPKYIVNTNSLISETRDHSTDLLKMISWLTSVPMDVLLKGNTPEKVEAMRLRLYNAVRRTVTKRNEISEGIKDILDIIFKLQKKEIKGEIKIQYSDPLPKSLIETVQAEAEKVTSGLSSKRSSIKRLEGYTDEEVEAELKLIEEENNIAGIGGADLKL